VLNQLIDSIIENLPLLVGCALQIIVKLAEEIANNYPKIVEKGGELVVKLVNGILDARQNVQDGIKQIVEEIWNKIQDTDWLSLGKNILSGIANGLWEGLQTVTDAISGVAENILNSFKNYFGIASPSKLMRDEIGKFMPQGVAVGFEEETPNAIDDMNRTLNSQITGIDVDGIYSQLQGLNYSQGSVPSYSNVASSGYASSSKTSEDLSNNTPRTVVVENYLFKNSQKLNSMVINASVLENARSGGNSI
jgi:phage-related protein